MNWPIILLCVTVGFAAVGLVAIVLTVIRWATVADHVSDLWVKSISVAIKFIAGVISLLGAYSATDTKSEWLPTVIAGAVCVLLWELLEKLVDSRLKAKDRTDKSALAIALRKCEGLSRLLTAIRFIVNEKSKRLRNNLRHKRPNSSSLKLLASGLTPADQVQEVLQSLGGYFQDQLNPNLTGVVRNFRVGLYVDRAGVMTPAVESVNLNNPGGDIFSSHETHQDAFRVSNAGEDAAQVVKCVRRRQTIIMEDCVAEAARGTFTFFRSEQQSYLRSMMACHIGKVCLPAGGEGDAVLSIDTDEPGFFKESDRNSLEFALREFGDRIKLEMILQSLLHKTGAHS